MGIVIDVILIAFLVLGTWAGVRKGLIKSAVSFVGLVAIVIISYSLRVPLADFLVDKLPFIDFGGKLAGLTTINILIYNVIAFLVIFILLYCILNIILALTGFIETILKFTVIWIIPSKIGGGIIGFLESWVYLFLVLFVLTQFSITSGIVRSGTVSNFMLDHTPVVGNFLGGATKAADEIYSVIEEYSKDETKTKDDINLSILQTEISYGLVTKEKANELIETGKAKLENVTIGKGINQWLDI